MKITDKIISIPPYISTSWDKVASLYMSDSELMIVLKDNAISIAIPHLSPETIEEIFSAHAAFLEQQLPKRTKEQLHLHGPIAAEGALGLPFRLFFGTLESINQALQHNPNYSDLPPLPPEIASKIEMLAKAMPSDDVMHLPDPAPGCSCVYCQMAKILKRGQRSPDHPPAEPTEEEVSEEELRFEQWDVHSVGDKMYLVTNKLDPNEHYSVYLGDPIGCTCGKPNCEHILAVLRH